MNQNFFRFKYIIHLQRFPSVTNIDPMVEDECSEHEAISVIEGVKYAANVWIRMRDNRNSIDENGCPAPYREGKNMET